MTKDQWRDPPPEKREPELQWVEDLFLKVLKAAWPLLAVAALYVLYRGIVTAYS